jgi:hypothetical protein
MKAYIGVLRHPFFAVTREDGSFEIKGVPPGNYTVVAWHEKFGEKISSVIVGKSSRGSADFLFTDSSNALRQSGSLEVAPALLVQMPGSGIN